MTRARDLANFVSNAQGDVRFDTDTLFIDSSANRVGIGTTTPDHSLSISSAATTQAELKSTATNGTAQIRYTNDARTYTQGVDNNDKFFLYDATGAASRLTVDTSGNFGIGTNSPVHDLQIHKSTSSSQSRIQMTTNESGATNSDGYAVAMETNGRVYHWLYENAFMQFATNNTERMRILADGGITFNGDTATDNALSDYERGDFTPTLTGYTSVTGTLLGKYVKIGSFVHCVVYMEITGLTYSGNTRITGWPFTPHRSINQHPGHGTIGTGTALNVDPHLYFFGFYNQTGNAYLYNKNTGGALTGNNYQTGVLGINVTYQTDS